MSLKVPLVGDAPVEQPREAPKAWTWAQYLTLASLSLTMFAAHYDFSSINLILAKLHSSSLHLSYFDSVWVINALALSFGSLCVAVARLADHVGHKWVLLAAQVLWMGASALGGAATNFTELVLARGLQGASVAAFYPLSLTIISASFEPQERGRVLGIWASVTGMGMGLGPVLGGWITLWLTWRGVFYVTILPIAVALVLAVVGIPRDVVQGGRVRRVDVLGLVCYIPGTTAVILGIQMVVSWEAAVSVGVILGGLVCLAIFVGVELWVKDPMVDFRLLKSRNFLGANVASFFVTFCLWAAFLQQPILFQLVWDADISSTGLYMLATTLVIVVFSPVAGALSDRVGSRWEMGAGFALFAISFVLLATQPRNEYFSGTFEGLLFLGFGFCLIFSPMASTALNAVQPSVVAVASGVLLTVRMLGASTGVAISSTTVGVAYKAASSKALAKHGWEDSFPTYEDKTTLTGLLDHHSASSYTQAVDLAKRRLHLSPGNTSHTIHTLTTITRDAFEHGLYASFWVIAAAAILAAILVWAIVRNRTHSGAKLDGTEDDDEDEDEDEDEEEEEGGEEGGEEDGVEEEGKREGAGGGTDGWLDGWMGLRDRRDEPSEAVLGMEREVSWVSGEGGAIGGGSGIGGRRDKKRRKKGTGVAVGAGRAGRRRTAASTEDAKRSFHPQPPNAASTTSVADFARRRSEAFDVDSSAAKKPPRETTSSFLQ